MALPPMVWLPPLVSELSKLRMPLLPTLVLPLSVRPPAMRSRPLVLVCTSSRPLSVTLSSTL